MEVASFYKSRQITKARSYTHARTRKRTNKRARAHARTHTQAMVQSSYTIVNLDYIDFDMTVTQAVSDPYARRLKRMLSHFCLLDRLPARSTIVCSTPLNLGLKNQI